MTTGYGLAGVGTLGPDSDGSATPAAAGSSYDFGSWSAAMMAASVADVPLKPGGRRRWGRADMLEALRVFDREHGRPPRYEELGSASSGRLPSGTKVSREFGSLSAWRREAGVSEVSPGWTAPGQWTAEEVIDAFRRFAAEHGRAPRTRDRVLAETDGRWPGHGVVIGIFGSWTAAVGAAGIHPHRRQWDRESITEALVGFAETSGRAPTTDDLGQGRGLPSGPTVYAHFGSFAAALDASGFGSAKRA